MKNADYKSIFIIIIIIIIIIIRNFSSKVTNYRVSKPSRKVFK